jgi:hypothetical protein
LSDSVEFAGYKEMAGQNQGGPSMEQFETFFRRADTDQDGRISGAEAVAFFQGSNLPKQVLAQVIHVSTPLVSVYILAFHYSVALFVLSQFCMQLKFTWISPIICQSELQYCGSGNCRK